MSALPKDAIRPVFGPLPDVQGEAGAVCPSVPEPAGNDAGVHPARGRIGRRTGNEGGTERFAFAFYRRANDYEYRHFSGTDELDAELKARAWAVIYGLVFDGRLSDRGLAIAQSV